MGDIGRAPPHAPGNLATPGEVSLAPRNVGRADGDTTAVPDPILPELALPQVGDATPPAIQILALVTAAARLQIGLPCVSTSKPKAWPRCGTSF